MKTMWKIVLAVGSVSTLMAQSDEVLRQQKILELQATKDGLKQTFQFIAGQLISGPPVKGAPYSAEAVNETVQTLADGNRIVQRTSTMQYRDSEGRERREETSAMGAIFINDPVAGVRYTLHPDSQTAEKGALPKLYATTNGADNAFFYVANGAVSTMPEGVGPDVAIGGGVAGGRGGPEVLKKFKLATASKVDKLGNMFIEGVQAEGTRTTSTIAAGDIGNERPINIVDERWYSSDLQMTVMSKHSDPRTGETNFTLKNINRSSPPPTLFEVPSDYTVKAGGPGQTIRVERRE
jgi:hypothetical protein